MFRVITAQRDELFADGTIRLLALFALLCVLDNLFHLVTCIAATVGIPTLACMNKRLNATLHGFIPSVRVLGILRIRDIDDLVDFRQLMRVSSGVVASGAKVEVFAGLAMVAGVRLVAVVACIRHVLILLSVQCMTEA